MKTYWSLLDFNKGIYFTITAKSHLYTSYCSRIWIFTLLVDTHYCKAIPFKHICIDNTLLHHRLSEHIKIILSDRYNSIPEKILSLSSKLRFKKPSIKSILPIYIRLLGIVPLLNTQEFSIRCYRNTKGDMGACSHSAVCQSLFTLQVVYQLILNLNAIIHSRKITTACAIAIFQVLEAIAMNHRPRLRVHILEFTWGCKCIDSGSPGQWIVEKVNYFTSHTERVNAELTYSLLARSFRLYLLWELV